MNQTFEEIMNKINPEDNETNEFFMTEHIKELIEDLEKSDIDTSETLSVSTVLEAINHVQEENSLVEDLYTTLENKQLELLKNQVAQMSRIAVDEMKEEMKGSKPDMELPSGELVSKQEVLEAIKTLEKDMNAFETGRKERIQSFLEKLEAYLKTRNIDDEEIQIFKGKYEEEGCLTVELTDEIKTAILASLEKQHMNENAKAMASEMLDEELKQKKAEEIKNFNETIEHAPHPLRSSYLKNYVECPIIPLDRYKNNKEELYRFSKDYGINKELIDDLLNEKSNKEQKEEAIKKIWQQLEDNHCILTDDQDQKEDIYQTLKNDLNAKMKEIVKLSPKGALQKIYNKLGFDEKQTTKLLENAIKNGTPGKDFYKVARKNLLQRQEEMRKKTEASIKAGNGSVRNNQSLKNDYLQMIRERQQMFENLYSLNRMVHKEQNNVLIEPNTFEIVKEEKVKVNPQTKKKIKESTIATHEYTKRKILKTLLHRHVNKNLAVGDVVMVEGMEYPITALSVVSKEKELMTVTPGETIEDLMKKLGIKSVTKGEFSFAVPIDGKNHFYDYNTPLEILPKQEEQRKVK